MAETVRESLRCVAWMPPVHTLFALFALILFLGCGDDDGPGTDRVINDVVITVEGGGAVDIGSDRAICCGDWEPGADRPTFKVLFYDAGQESGGWKLFLDRERVESGRSYALPATEVLTLFVLDISSGNELSTDGEGASGTITVHELACGPPARIRITFDDVIAPSEFHDAPSVRVSGTLDATVYGNDAGPGCDFGI